ncbi:MULTISPECIES: DUF1254 domain-containing protein [unclassified Sphingomonas]|uniref:DUF1254 domain-containing protein n=1 Tax=unclassified Sphingomonas TaxID=196159 RepID=UPI0022699510|nr:MULTISPECIES: DUF1254 domain-containing protein [unclassified Sphingomonas]
MRRWIDPLLLGAAFALVAWRVTLVETPRVVMARAVSRLGEGRFNRFVHAPLATAAARTIVRPSPDLAYSSCAFDLLKGPLVVAVPPMPSPYWSLSVFDAHTDVAYVRNGVQARGGPIRIAVALGGQRVPAGVPVVRVGGRRGVALLRILVQDHTRFAPIDAARHGATCATG